MAKKKVKKKAKMPSVQGKKEIVPCRDAKSGKSQKNSGSVEDQNISAARDHGMPEFVKMLKCMAERLNEWAKHTEPRSLEGVSRELRLIIKQLCNFLGDPSQQICLTEERETELNEVLDWMEEANAEMYIKFRRAVGFEEENTANPSGNT